MGTTQRDLPVMRGRRRTLVGLGALTAALGFIYLWGLSPLALPVARGHSRQIIPLIPRLSTGADPLPLRRIVLPADRIPGELERVQHGTLLQLGRDAFEASVGQADLAGEALRFPPRIASAQYRAKLVGFSLVGDAELTISHTAAAPGILPLSSLGLALRSAQLDKVEAILGDLDGKGLALLVEKPGKHLLAMEWSARGEPTPEGLRFELKWPGCALTRFELDLPASHSASLPHENGLLLGPSPSKRPDRKLWQLYTAGQSQVDVVIRAAPSNSDSSILARIQGRQVWKPGLIEAEFDCNLRSVQGSISQIQYECMAGFRPTRLTLHDEEVHSWEFRPAKNSDLPGLLLVHLPESFRGRPLSLLVQGVAPAQPGQLSVCPGLRLVNGITTSETMTLEITPEIQLEDWQQGNFDMIRSASGANGHLVLSLQSGIPVQDASAPGRPSARPRLIKPDVRTTQRSWWRVQPRDMSLTVEVAYSVLHGRLHRTGLLLPKGWSADRVELQPAGLLRYWNPSSAEDGQTLLTIELERPLEATNTLSVTVHLLPARGENALTQDRPAQSARLAFPVIVPQEGIPGEGLFAITVDPGYQSNVSTEAPPQEAPAWDHISPGSDSTASTGPPIPPLGSSAVLPISPWASSPPDYLYRYRGAHIKAVLEIRPRQPRVRARILTEVVLASRRLGVVTRIHVQPEIGHPSHVDLNIFGPTSARWQWRVPGNAGAIKSVARLEAMEALPYLLGLNQNTAFGLAALTQSSGPSSQWRITLSSPLREPLTFESSLELSGPNEAAFLGVPLVWVNGAETLEGEVRLHPLGTGFTAVETLGLHEAQTTGPAATWRSFHYNQQPIALGVRGRAVSVEGPPSTRIDLARLTTFVQPGGRLLHFFSFDLHDWSQLNLPIRLPERAELVSAKVDERWLMLGTPQAGSDGTVILDLPVPAGAGGHLLEICYATSERSWQSWTRLTAPMPGLPVSPTDVRQIWCLPDGVVPLDTSRLQQTSNSRPLAAIDPVTWTTWEWSAGDPSETLLVVRPEKLRPVAWTVAGMVLVWGWRGRRSRHRACWALPTLALAITGLAAYWLPQPSRDLLLWPALACAVVIILWYVRALIGFSPVTMGYGKSIAGGALTLALVTCVSAQPLGQDKYMVWLLPHEATGKEKSSVLVSPVLIEELRELAHRGAAGLSSPVILSAHYDGKLEDTAARLIFEFRVWAFSDNPTDLALPLFGGDLQDASIDDIPAQPQALRSPLSGYAVKIAGRGLHLLRLRLVARLDPSGDDQELRLIVPEIARSQLALHAPGYVRYLHAVMNKGSQDLVDEPGGKCLQADLGRVNTLHCRWRQERAQPTAATVDVREMYLWDLQGPIGALQGSLQYTIKRGAASALRIALPPGLEVRRVEASGPTGEVPGPRLQKWHQQGSGDSRLLILDFQFPVTSEVQVYLELVPLQPLGPQATLALPRPLDAVGTAGFLAYRIEGRQVARIDHTHITGIEPVEFVNFWQSVRPEDLDPPQQAFRFRRAPGSDPLLRLTLQRPRSALQCSQEVTWRIAPDLAEFRATAKLVAPERNLVLVEWDVPTEILDLDVRGPDVRSWSRAGSCLQIWLRQSLPETQLELTGWARRDPTTIPMRLPCLVVRAAEPQTTLLHIRPARGFALHLTDMQNLTAMPVPSPLQSGPSRTPASKDQGEQSFLSAGPLYAANVRIQATTTQANARLVTLLEALNGTLRFVTTLEYEIHAGDLPNLTVRLRNWTGSDIQLEGTQILDQHEQRDPFQRSWTLHLKPLPAGRYRLHVSGSMPAEGLAEVLMPDVKVEGLGQVPRWVAVGGRELQPTQTRGLTTAPLAGAALQGWPASEELVRQATGAVWKIDRRGWQMRLNLQPARAPSDLIQVLFEEQAAKVVRGQFWLHEANYLLFHDSGSDVEVRLPESARLIRLTLDDSEVSPLQVQGERLWMPLTGDGPFHWLHIWWQFPAEDEEFDQPDLRSPAIISPNSAADDALWIVQGPPGYGVSAGRADATPIPAARRDLRRAAAEFAQCRLLLERNPGTLTPAQEAMWSHGQERFYRTCKRVENDLGLADTKALPSTTVSIELGQLHAANRQLALAHNLDRERALAERHAALPPSTILATDPRQAGTPLSPVLPSVEAHSTYWIASVDLRGPHVHLVSDRIHQREQKIRYSVLLLLLAITAWILSYLPQTLPWCRRTWPEQLMAVGLVTWGRLPFDWLLGLLLIAGLASRGILLIRWLRERSHRATPTVIKHLG